MDPEYARAYRRLYERHWWWRARERLVLRRLNDMRPGGKWGRILDVGCGDGLFFDALSQLGDVQGVEPDSSLIAADGRWRDRIAVRPFDDTFAPGHRYDLILFLDVLEHMEHPLEALLHARSLLESNGIVLITVPASMRLWSGHDELNRHFHRYDRDELVGLARDAGLEVVDVRHAFHWVYPARRAARLLESMRSGPARPPRVPPAPVNALLYALTRLEQVLLPGDRVPFGSSLVLGARRRP